MTGLVRDTHILLPRPRFILFSIAFFLSFFVSLPAILRENGWTDLREILREGVERSWDDQITFLVNSDRLARCTTRGRGLLCFRTTACLIFMLVCKRLNGYVMVSGQCVHCSISCVIVFLCLRQEVLSSVVFVGSVR